MAAGIHTGRTRKMTEITLDRLRSQAALLTVLHAMLQKLAARERIDPPKIALLYPEQLVCGGGRLLQGVQDDSKTNPRPSGALVAGGELGGVVERVDGCRVGQVVGQVLQWALRSIYRIRQSLQCKRFGHPSPTARHTNS